MEEAQILKKLDRILKSVSHYTLYCDDTFTMGDQMRLGALKSGMREIQHKVLELHQELGGLDESQGDT